MPRKARKRSSTGIYHVMLRGINRESIFVDDEDRQLFLDILFRFKTDTKASLYAYCLMDNHVHLLIKENLKEIEAINKQKYDGKINTPTPPTIDVIMRKIATSYAMKYNHKYSRVGHLFQDRYRSEAIEEESYFISCIKYIHQNPIKAKVSESCDFYWSSYNLLLDRLVSTENGLAIACETGLDTAYIKYYFTRDTFVEFMHQP